MLLKDLTIEKYFYNRSGESLDFSNIEVTLSGNVIIKREGKHYSVPIVKTLERKISEYTVDELELFIFSFLLEANKIEENWKLVGELTKANGTRMLGETPVEL